MIWLCVTLAVVPARGADDVDYVSDVLPILETYCIGCHTEDEAQGGFVMESHEALLRGGDSGLAITAGAADSSRLLLMVRGEMEPVMPPEGEQRPNESELETIAAWIEQGAMGPDGDMPIKRALRTPTIEPDADVNTPITAIAFTGDGQRRAVARYGQVEITENDGTVVSELSRELNKVNALQFSRDGKRLLVASGVTGAYGNAAIFDVGSGELIREMVGHRDVMYAAVFSPDETLVATAGYDRKIVLWDAASGKPVRELLGHNGAIFDLAFSPDGKVLVSACADETAKVWRVADGARLDTLNQPEAEVLTVAVTDDGKFILAGSADNRLRVWRLRSIEKPRINPVVATRFVDESPLIDFDLTPDGKALVVLSEAGNLKVIGTSDWNQVAALEPLGETGSDVEVSADGHHVFVSLMNGQMVTRELPKASQQTQAMAAALEPVYLDLESLSDLTETQLQEQQQTSEGDVLEVPRGSKVSGSIDSSGQVDAYRWRAEAGEVWAIDADATNGSSLDPIVAIFDQQGEPVLRKRLQAVRDSYFTFRGKDSNQIGDFRLFNWQEMHLDDYLYANGEVTRLFMYPRGPDSGYNVYPNEGERWTYFGTSHTTHALGEPAYIVRPLEEGQTPVANGLPVFDIYYENDDDPQRMAGKNSRLLFTAPSDDLFTVRVADTRGDGGDGFGYTLKIRPAEPGFKPSLGRPNETLRRGTGREFTVRVDRLDGFDGPVVFEATGLPEQVVSNFPITVQPGQRYAVGTLWVDEHAEAWSEPLEPRVTANAEILGRKVIRDVGTLGPLKLGERPNAIPVIQPIDGATAENENWTLQVHRGETVSAKVVIRRKEGFSNEVSFGKENSGRNTAHGVYVDNIGLNGLLVRQDENEREFFLTADPVAELGKRSFFLTAEIEGKVTTHPITVEVLP